MSVIQVNGKEFEPYLTAAQIDKEIKRLGAKLNSDYLKRIVHVCF